MRCEKQIVWNRGRLNACDKVPAQADSCMLPSHLVQYFRVHDNRARETKETKDWNSLI